VGEEVDKLGGEYIVAALWIASDKGGSVVKPFLIQTYTG